MAECGKKKTDAKSREVDDMLGGRCYLHGFQSKEKNGYLFPNWEMCVQIGAERSC